MKKKFKLKRPLWTYIFQGLLVIILLCMYIYGDENTRAAISAVFVLTIIVVFTGAIIGLWNLITKKENEEK